MPNTIRVNKVYTGSIDGKEVKLKVVKASARICTVKINDGAEILKTPEWIRQHFKITTS